MDGLELSVVTIAHTRHALTFTWAKCPDWCAPKGASATSSSMSTDSAQRPLPKSEPWESKPREKHPFLWRFMAKAGNREVIICPWEQMPFWQWCSYIDPLALSWGRITQWLTGEEAYELSAFSTKKNMLAPFSIYMGLARGGLLIGEWKGLSGNGKQQESWIFFATLCK